MSEPGAVDVHAHVLDPSASTVPGAAYAPFPAGPADHLAHLGRLGFARGVLVTASVHGTDNGPLTAALRAAPERLAGIAVVPPEVTDTELDALDAVGVRGVRLQDLFPGGAPLETLPVLAPRLAERGWHVEIWTDLAAHLHWLPDALRTCGVPVVLDHMGFLGVERGPRDAAVQAMVDLARDGVWITLSGAYRLAPASSPAEAAAHLADRVYDLLEQVPERLLWGSDWPHVAPPGAAPTTDDLRAELDLWFPDPAARRRVLVDNPTACYRM